MTNANTLAGTMMMHAEREFWSCGKSVGLCIQDVGGGLLTCRVAAAGDRLRTTWFYQPKNKPSYRVPVTRAIELLENVQ